MPRKADKLVKCQRCGWKGRVPQGQRKCYQPRFGRGSYSCWGDLGRVVRKAKPLEHPAGWYLGQEEQQPMEQEKSPRKARKTPQEVAAKKRDHAQGMVNDMTARMNRLARSLRKWQTKATQYGKRAAMTDAQLEQEKADRVRRAEQRARKRRGISLRKQEGA